MEAFLSSFSAKTFRKAQECFAEQDWSQNQAKLHFRKGVLEFNNPDATFEDLQVAKKHFETTLKFRKNKAELYLNVLKNENVEQFLLQNKAEADSMNTDISIFLLLHKLTAKKESSLITLQLAVSLVERNCAEAVLLLGNLVKRTVLSPEETNSKNLEKTEPFFFDQENPQKSLEEFLNQPNKKTEAVQEEGISERSKKSLLSFHRTRAQQGDAHSQVVLGQLHQSGGFGLERDDSAAEQYYTQAAETDSAAALNNLGHLRLNSIREQYLNAGEERNLEVELSAIEGINYFLRAAKQNNKQALYNLGIIYLHGLYYQDKDEHLGLSMLAQAAVADSEDAFYQIGSYLLSNQERINNFTPEEADSFYNSLSSIETVLEARENKAVLRTPIFYFRHSHLLGSNQGTFTYALLLAFPNMQNGEVNKNDIKQSEENTSDCKKAFRLLTNLMEENEDVLFLTKRAEMALQKKNYSAALLNYTVLAKLGLYNSVNNVVGLLRVLEEKDKGLLARTKRFLRLSNDPVISETSFLGKLLANKSHLTQVFTDYLEFMSAFDGYTSLRVLGDVLLARQEVLAAVQNYARAAEKGDGKSAFNLAWLYTFGTKVEQDLDAAKKYVNLSSDNGGKNAAFLLHKLIRILELMRTRETPVSGENTEL